MTEGAGVTACEPDFQKHFHIKAFELGVKKGGPPVAEPVRKQCEWSGSCERLRLEAVAILTSSSDLPQLLSSWPSLTSRAPGCMWKGKEARPPLGNLN